LAATARIGARHLEENLAKPLDLLRRICSVPGTDVPLDFGPDCSGAGPDGRRFRAIRGVPILRSEALPVVERPTDYVSGGLPQYLIDHVDLLPGYTLFLGAGNSNFRHPRVIEVEFDLFRDTDVVADAHAFPFRSNSFELVIAMNVFEHLRQPFDAAREVLRVLAPGGEVLIHTAFLQPLHEAPAHFFNATEFGVREWFRDFSDVACHVAQNLNPLYGLSWIAHDLLATLEREVGKQAAEAIGALRIDDIAAFWRQQAGWNPEAAAHFFALPEIAQRPIAAGFELRARKPRTQA
jgi:SAM-dependent methyltransferase